ncbi:Carboxymuconolactone decarboxylase family protein [Streptomyces sp. YIM 130001]|uniref:carboxymuconolactone decarboxylase family protein n=1 Tax=Streptomyces sp. YIM 130001 TaxID=2259644 RepID=UPI000E64DC40|nr:carboxymuconolactone decarboxylase family protein [Streptomyces sp. YIM 130001]RII07910.1 Carboxymuconolactone decarboxylase family protein [Streptomyces sp. YIM 130001]
MPHIALNNDLPGIVGLMSHRPDTAAPLNELADALLRAPSPLTRGERELIAAYVSERNETRFCADSHGAFAAAQLDGGRGLVQEVLGTPADRLHEAPVAPRLQALLRIAAEVRQQAKPVSGEAMTAARAVGVGDTEIHDTVLIAAAFSMYNRYVNCLDTSLPDQGDYYTESAQHFVRHGYSLTAAATVECTPCGCGS